MPGSVALVDASAALTLGTYSHVEPELANEAAQRIGRALWTDGTKKAHSN